MEERQQQLLQQKEAKQNLKTQIQNSPTTSENKQSSRPKNKSQCNTSQSKNHTKIAKHCKNAYSNASSYSSSSHKRKNAHSKTCNCKKCKRQPKKSSCRIRKKTLYLSSKHCKMQKRQHPPTPPKNTQLQLEENKTVPWITTCKCKTQKYNTERASGLERDCYLLIKTCKCNIVVLLLLLGVVVPHVPPHHHHHHPSSSSSFSATKKQHHQKQQQHQ